MSKTLLIRQLSRVDADGAEETLHFTEGVNVMVGPSNSGKTAWLAMLDFVLGDPGTADDGFLRKEDAVGRKLATLYSELRAVIEIDEQAYVLERKWKEPNLVRKTVVDGVPMSTAEFSAFILEKLHIPTSRFVKGNPYTEGSVLDISFRMMLRHIFRQERFWSDLADSQFPYEQHAVLTQFLGLADKMLSSVDEKLLEKRRELSSAEIKRNQFLATLDQIVRSLNYDGGQNLVFATDNAAAERIKGLEKKVSELLQQRAGIIQAAAAGLLPGQEVTRSVEVQLSQQRAVAVTQLEQLEVDREKHELRLRRYENMLKSATAELERLNRVKSVGGVFADLQVTHCPACDQPVSDVAPDPDTCFLCHQTLPDTTANGEDSRLDFELQQLRSEQEELTGVLTKMQAGKAELTQRYHALRTQIDRLDRELAPIKQKLAGLVDARLSVLDQQRGRLLEQIETFRRIAESMKFKERLDKVITTLTSQIADLEKDVARRGKANFEQAADDLEAGMADYINAIAKDNRNRWNLTGRINLNISEKGFDFNIGRTKWSSIGGTTKLYFLFAYHYGLLSLTGKKDYHYPGLLIMDFPATLPDGEQLKGAENYLVQPFIDLCNASPVPLQVIVAGQSFEGLTDCHVIPLTAYEV
ncbi:coiled-coil domain-containing protein [Hymenobacter pini]|uniref:hypothetical protein n=1 Tax=Hymenobacter pini TaxID=2880879 RepID=UPI001CF32503|nr:hypothetical protein [Hymenobacter pini]MCA8833311.1 hypothetical protein [Hymenobacter pini]